MEMLFLTEDSVNAMNAVTKGGGISIISDKEVSGFKHLSSVILIYIYRYRFID